VAANQLSQAGLHSTVECRACHVKGGNGRFPHLSNQISQYCNTVLAQAITRTMPPGSPGSEATVANAFRNAWCGGPPNSSSADAGDPHITTTNGINYDFQAAGEFTALRTRTLTLNCKPAEPCDYYLYPRRQSSHRFGKLREPEYGSGPARGQAPHHLPTCGWGICQRRAAATARGWRTR